MAALGRPGYINLDRNTIFGSDERTLELMQSQANLVLDTLFQYSSSSNVPWVDCARSYGLSEKFTGEYLRQNNIDPKNVYVSSKWGYSKSSHVPTWSAQQLVLKTSMVSDKLSVPMHTTSSVRR